jgi:hypothetical protein
MRLIGRAIAATSTLRPNVKRGIPQHHNRPFERAHVLPFTIRGGRGSLKKARSTSRVLMQYVKLTNKWPPRLLCKLGHNEHRLQKG